MVFPSPFAAISGKTNFNPQSTALPQNAQNIPKEPIPKQEEDNQPDLNTKDKVEELQSMMQPQIFTMPHPTFNNKIPEENIMPAPQTPHFTIPLTPSTPQQAFNQYPTIINPYQQYQESLIPHQPQMLTPIQQPQRLNPNRLVFV